MKMISDEITTRCSEIKSTYKITGEEAKDLEESTRLQSKSRLWSIHRTGRITASNFKSVLRQIHLVFGEKDLLPHSIHIFHHLGLSTRRCCYRYVS